MKKIDPEIANLTGRVITRVQSVQRYELTLECGHTVTTSKNPRTTAMNRVRCPLCASQLAWTDTDDPRFPVLILDVDTTEEMVLNTEGLAPALHGWRNYRVEYGGPNEECLYEGRIMLPAAADPVALVQLIMGMQVHSAIWRSTVPDDVEEFNQKAEAQDAEETTT